MTASSASPSPSPQSVRPAAARDRRHRRLWEMIFQGNREYAEGSIADFSRTDGVPVDFLLAAEQDHMPPEEIFGRLRWGGQFVYASTNRAKAAALEHHFNGRGGFVMEQPLKSVRLRGALPFFGRTHHYFIARKTLLVPPGENSERFTYHVELVKREKFGHEYVVMKQVPTFERVLGRLREKFPDADSEELSRRARKFTEKIFPVFLTRETAILRILERYLPPEFRPLVPRVLGAEKDAKGFSRTLYMNWLRNGRAEKPLTQLAFARQAAELLHALHDVAGVIHLDLRLDNMVVTRKGVGFVDFGSAVRLGEMLEESNLLTNLFEEMMRTSQIQRMMGQMQDSGQITSREIRNSYQKVDKAVDFFYLAVQINGPLSNQDFRGLVDYDPKSAEAAALAELTAEILRPKNPEHPPFRSARDILDGILHLEQRLASPEGIPPPATANAATTQP